MLQIEIYCIWQQQIYYHQLNHIIPYTKPRIHESSVGIIKVKNARHPLAEIINNTTFIENDIVVSIDDVKALGYQTEEQVRALIASELEEVENGSY